MVKHHPLSAWASCANCNQEVSAGSCSQGDRNPWGEAVVMPPAPGQLCSRVGATPWRLDACPELLVLDKVASSFKVLEQLGNLHSTSLLCVAVTCYCQLGRNYELKTPWCSFSQLSQAPGQPGKATSPCPLAYRPCCLAFLWMTESSQDRFKIKAALPENKQVNSRGGHDKGRTKSTLSPENESLQLRNKITPGCLSPFQSQMCPHDLYVKNNIKTNQIKTVFTFMGLWVCTSLWLHSDN